MNGEPAKFFTLSPEAGKSHLLGADGVSLKEVSKLRIDPKTMQIDLRDTTFMNTGGL